MSLISWVYNSKELGQETGINIALPNRDAGGSGTPAGVLYLLHGLTGNHTVWARFGDVERLADRHNLAIVMPSGGRSFWVNERHGQRYFSWLTEELPALVKSTFKVAASREQTLIAGLSMGGYGAFVAALNRPENYCAAGAFSGTLDIREEAFQQRHRDAFAHSFAADPGAAGQDLLALLDSSSDNNGNKPQLWASCGTEDRLLQQNRVFVEAARAADYRIDYREGPGGHEWSRWNQDLIDFLAHCAPARS